MSKKALLPVVVVGILIILTGLFLWFEQMGQEREEEIARYSGGTDELSQTIVNEADQYRYRGTQTQLGFLATGVVIVVIVLVWWIAQRNREPK